ncbi:MAG: hypothetical protein JST14_17410 [Bacteroidetes bacterium]|nr:hypothetical protein [Bacteroidota bacterium]
MRHIGFLLLVISCTACFAQDEQSKLSDTSSINIVEILGMWSNVRNSAEKLNGLKTGIGQVSDNKKITIPVQGESTTGFIRFDPDGNFIDVKNPNSKWRITNNTIVVTNQFGQDINLFLSKRDSIRTYFLTYKGEVFEKKY